MKKYICFIVIVVSILAFYKNTVNATSNDTGLKSLGVTPIIGSLSQDEDNSKIYRAKVNNNITEVNIEATPSNENASVEIEGNKGLQVGTNKVTITVTAENGDKEKYVVYVRRSSEPIANEEIVPNVQEKSTEEEKKYNNESNNTNELNVNENNNIDENTSENIIDKNTDNEVLNENNINNNEYDVEEKESISKKKIIIIACVILIGIGIIIILIKNNKK